MVNVEAIPLVHFKKSFIDPFNQVAQTFRKEDGCLEYELYQKDPLTSEVFIFDRWESQEFLEAHKKTEHLNRFLH